MVKDTYNLEYNPESKMFYASVVDEDGFWHEVFQRDLSDLNDLEVTLYLQYMSVTFKTKIEKHDD